MSSSVPTVPLERPRQLLALAFAAAGVWYLGWRVATFNTDAPWLSGLLLVAECISIAALLAQAGITWRTSQPVAAPVPEEMPVDVFVLAGSHPVDILRKTLRSALALHGPHSVSLLAPASTHPVEYQQLLSLTQELGCRWVHTSDHEPAPATLANQALAATRAPFVAWLDGDQACRRDFLTQTLDHFSNPQVAFVQTAPGVPGEGPASAAAGAARRTWWAELFTPVVAHRALKRGWDRWQATVWTGNGAVLRRSAVEAAGGFAADSACPFAATTVRIQAQGAHGVWHDERLTFSLAPESDAAQIRPRSAALAWAVLLRERVLGRAGLTLAQRLRYLGDALAASAPLHTSVFLLVPGLALVSNALPFNAAPAGFAVDLALHLLPVLLLGGVLQSEVSRGELSWFGLRAHQLARLGQGAQAALLAVNSLAVLGGIVMAWALAAAAQLGAPNTGPAAVASGVLAAWAALNTLGLLGALQAAARTEGRDRTRQRFTVTLAAELTNATGERVQGTVDDLSEAGLRFYGSLLPSMAQSQVLSGTLHLPDGPLAFSGEVRHLGASSNESMHQPRSVGLRLALDPVSKARVETFLFSSDLQWHIQGHTETPATPLSLLLPGLQPATRPALARRHWNGAQLRLHILAEATPVLCAASDGIGGPDLIVSHTPLPEQLPLILDVFRRMAVPSRGVTLLRLHDAGSTAAGATALYTYRVDAAEMPIVPMEYQTLASPFVLVEDEPLVLHTAERAAPAGRADKIVEAETLTVA